MAMGVPMLLPALLLALPMAAAVEVGMMYEGWQAPAYWGRAPNNVTCERPLCRSLRGQISALTRAAALVTRALAVCLALHTHRLEGVIRSNGSLSMASVSSGMNSKSMGFWWHKQPKDGFYCIYRKRDTENVSSCGLPDCPGNFVIFLMDFHRKKAGKAPDILYFKCK